MGFFARPNLDDIQFKQLSGTTLTLSGTTNFTGVLKSKGTEIDATTGITTSIGDVLTFDGSKIVLSPSTSGGTGNYPYPDTTTCTVGGLCAGSCICNEPIVDILQQILVPTLNPTLTPPSSTFSVSLSNPYEVGAVVSAVGCTILNRGCICPQYTSVSDKRSCGAISHNYVDFNGVSCSCPVPVSTLNCTYSMPAYPVVVGNRTAYGSVSYCAGIQPKDSAGNNYSTPLVSGTTSPVPAVICGLYPYFWGKVASGGCPAGCNRPTPTCALVIAGNKVVVNSSGTVYINFGSSADDYIWFAIPDTSTSKTCWYVNALNNGSIGGAVTPGGNLFPAYASVNPVTTVYWSGQTYKVYISNYQTASGTLMELRNS